MALMNIYLAADFGRADDANEVAQLLERSARDRVVSRWHKHPSAAESAAASRVGGPAERVARDAAERNLKDIDACDVFIVLTTGTPARGGRHFETGYAFALGKPIMVVGPVEHAFQHLSNVVVSDASQLTDALANALPE
jgi:nucleoside 2-deoxyribosyltransferase